MPEETIETITKSYEEKIATREKEFLKEKENLIKTIQEETDKKIKELKEQHNKEIADIILGRKDVSNINKETEKENDEKSFFETAVEKTKKKLKEG